MAMGDITIAAKVCVTHDAERPTLSAPVQEEPTPGTIF